MRRATVLLALVLVLPASASLAQGPYPSPQATAAADTARHRAGAAASTNGATEATLAPVRRARGDCALDGLAAACAVSPSITASN